MSRALRPGTDTCELAVARLRARLRRPRGAQARSLFRPDDTAGRRIRVRAVRDPGEVNAYDRGVRGRAAAPARNAPAARTLGAHFARMLAAALVSIVSTRAAAIETSVTVSARHDECDQEIWQHLERQARERAEAFCAERDGVDPRSLRFVHHDSPYGAEQLCVVHLHYACVGELPGDDGR